MGMGMGMGSNRQQVARVVRNPRSLRRSLPDLNLAPYPDPFPDPSHDPHLQRLVQSLCPFRLAVPPQKHPTDRFALLSRSTTLTTIWLETFGISLAFTFLVADIIVIVVRNNLSCTKAILATRRYQVIEKFVVAPTVGIYKMFEGMLCRLLC